MGNFGSNILAAAKAASEDFEDIHDRVDEVFRECCDGHGGRAIDYGCSNGNWAFATRNFFDELIGVDINQDAIETAKFLAKENNWENVRFVNSLEENIMDIKDIDFIYAIDLFPVMHTEHIHEVFEFARNNLRPGGRLLCTTRRPVLFLYELAILRRFRRDYDGLLGGLRRYLALLRSAIEAYAVPEIQRIGRARYYLRVASINRIAKLYGLTPVPV